MRAAEKNKCADSSSIAMATTEASDAQSQAIADEVTSALGHLAKTAEADLEAGEDGGGASATDTLITTVAKSMISKVDSETSISLLRRGATYCWGKVRGSLTKENVVATFGTESGGLFCFVAGDSAQQEKNSLSFCGASRVSYCPSLDLCSRFAM